MENIKEHHPLLCSEFLFRQCHSTQEPDRLELCLVINFAHQSVTKLERHISQTIARHHAVKYFAHELALWGIALCMILKNALIERLTNIEEHLGYVGWKAGLLTQLTWYFDDCLFRLLVAKVAEHCLDIAVSDSFGAVEPACAACARRNQNALRVKLA